MKSFAVVAVAAFAGLAVAQDLSAFGNLPACAVPCITGGLGSTGCKTTDIKCICSNEKFLNDLLSCVTKGCSAADVSKAADFSKEFCGDSIPSAIVNAATSAVAGATGTSNVTAAATPTSSGSATSKGDATGAGAINKPAAVVAGLMAVVGAIVA